MPRLIAVGDVFLDRDDPHTAFTATAAYLRTADVSFANVEAPISDRGELKPWASKFPLRMRPAMVAGLVDAGFRVVSLANNHTMDYSTDALLDTIGLLRAHGIESVGAGRNVDEAQRPTIMDVAGVRVGFLAFQATEHDRPDIGAKESIPGLNQLRLSPFYPEPQVSPSDIAMMEASIRRLREHANIVVTSFHWGIAGSLDLSMPQVGLATRAAGAGADLVIGHHTHVPQAVVKIGRTVVAFGLGNFVFDWEYPHFVTERLILECDFDANGVREVLARPAAAGADRAPVLLDAEDAREICHQITSRGGGVGEPAEYAPDAGGLRISLAR